MNRTRLIAHLRDLTMTYESARLSKDTLIDIINELTAPQDDTSESNTSTAAKLLIHLDERSQTGFSRGDNDLRQNISIWLNHQFKLSQPEPAQQALEQIMTDLRTEITQAKATADHFRDCNQACEKRISELNKQVAELTAQQTFTWHPIETLPRDGTPVIAWSEPMSIPDVAWHEASGSTLRSYTHWMDLPKPPITAPHSHAQPPAHSPHSS